VAGSNLRHFVILLSGRSPLEALAPATPDGRRHARRGTKY
jgi:hypothetical protein